MFWQQAKLERIACHLMSAAFRSGALEPLTPLVETVEQSNLCRPEALPSAIIIRLRLPEDAMAAAARREIDGSARCRLRSKNRPTARRPINSFGRSWPGSGVFPDTIALFTGPGWANWPIRDPLLASLKNVGELQHEGFAKTLCGARHWIDAGLSTSPN
jgi:hypothetical protein